MSNELATQSPVKDPKKLADQLAVSEMVVKMLQPQQLGWLKLARDKVVTFESLAKQELEVQGLCKELTASNNLAKVQELLKKAKDITAASMEQRLVFTNTLNDKLISPAMAYEKRNKELLTKAEAHELELRKQAELEKKAGEAKQKEEAAFKTHVANEHIRIGTSYKLELTKMVSDAYITALKGPIPPDEIPEYISKVKGFIQDVKLEPFIRFERTIEKYNEDKKPVYKYIDDKRAMEIFKSIEAYNPAEDLQQALSDLHEKFAMYDHDYKNAKKAAASEKAKQEEVAGQISEQAEQEMATNQLMSQVDTYTSTAPGAKTTIKRKFEIEKVNNESWALAVLSAFIKNWSVAKTHLKVKSWEKLTLSQMGAALSNMKTQDNKLNFENLKFIEIEK